MNITQPSGGAEEESDLSLMERTFLAPSGYSVAGPDDAYVYWVRSFSQTITDAKASSPRPVVVDIRLLLTGGELPDDTFVAALREYLKTVKVRPLTDHVIIGRPDLAEYEISAVYYIRAADRNSAEAIQRRAEEAVNRYVKWQGMKIGRDINPSVLNQLLREAGVKRPEIAAPAFRVVTDTQVARCKSLNLRYGGLEDD